MALLLKGKPLERENYTLVSVMQSTITELLFLFLSSLSTLFFLDLNNLYWICCSELLTGVVPYTDLRAEAQVSLSILCVGSLKLLLVYRAV